MLRKLIISGHGYDGSSSNYVFLVYFVTIKYTFNSNRYSLCLELDPFYRMRLLEITIFYDFGVIILISTAFLKDILHEAYIFSFLAVNNYIIKVSVILFSLKQG
ncbi:uncharacterized protein A4U43_C03F16330 [Asparagus officinalis]|uniref:Uncharacterized protein n=1 Tax=Asparagus officinalis TaxID=4686 RepID=A0A5P1FAJ4_ASPOF|nr:uncharacterized protein A4U43_C03F16330 [Asparagus officinalis]